MTRVLNVVAHHDDDLLFLSPTLMKDLRDGNTVRTIFLVASDYHTFPTYMQARELGVREAYAAAAGLTALQWKPHAYGAGNLPATLWTLGNRVSIVENRLPDTSTAPENRLWLLYSRNQSLTGRPLDFASAAQGADRATVVAFLRAAIADFQPDVIRTTDPSADLQRQQTPSLSTENFYFHRDHVAAARLVQTAVLDVSPVPQVVYYRDYTIRDEPGNQSGADTTFKRNTFRTYAAHDVDICPNGGVNCPPSGGFYDDLMNKQYVADATWFSDHAIPLTADDPGKPWPVIGQHFNVRNRGTNLELAVNNASTADLEPIIGWPQSGSANQRWRFEANPQGWELVASHSGKAFDVPESSQSGGVQLIQFARTGGVNQTVRLRGNPTAGWRLLLAHSGLAVSVQGGGNGAPIVQQAFTGAANQLWDLVPA
ncbi:GlcNAc-PI de-N-acetylase [Lentzea fradiae]|uniref:GlcNAc-PI de-N-acetylase n=1 Tax=Lentzea fradiae TaxID=200378 RepID=A0A1G7UDH2_9PSEU|nr:RICIN domain-containing protein [Lentzea fradiae]SDG45497.1 GlcNAc-PI de-N-acetylase [Lentzea fradiae]